MCVNQLSMKSVNQLELKIEMTVTLLTHQMSITTHRTIQN